MKDQIINQIKAIEKKGTRIVSFVYKGEKVKNVLIGSNRMKMGPWGNEFADTRSLQENDKGELYLKGLDNNSPDPDRRERIYSIDRIEGVLGL